jgi:hypothetical protein
MPTTDTDTDTTTDTTGSFGWALERLRSGRQVARPGWNGKGMYLVYTPQKSITAESSTDEHSRQHGEPAPGSPRAIGARLDFMAADRVVELGWRPTSRDMLAADWVVVG